MAGGRTKNAKRNIVWGTINQIVTLFIPFLIRTIIINELGVEYLGLNSLFSSILQVLNLVELGFASAMIYSMYKPVAEHDTNSICALLSEYRRVYRIIGLIVITLGLCVLPALPNLINGSYPNDINLYVLYLIFLLNSSISYFFFAYKSSLLIVHQRADIVSTVNIFLQMIKYAIQITLLFVYHNYYLYIVLLPIFTVLSDIIIAIVSKRLYPEFICRGSLDHRTRAEIWKRVAGLMFSRLCGVTRNSFASVFISAMIGLTAVAIYGNYFFILSAVIGLLHVLTSSMSAGVGNSVAIQNPEKNYNDMQKLIFIYAWISGICTVCLLCLYQPFMELWVGSELMFPMPIIVMLCIYFYVLTMGDIRSLYGDSVGIWWEARTRAILESVANLVLTFVLGYFFGLAGIISGTLISLFFINFLFGSHYIFKLYFKNRKLPIFFLQHLMYLSVTAFSCASAYLLCGLVHLSPIWDLFLKLCISLIIPNIIYFFIYSRTRIFKESLNHIKFAMSMSIR